MSKEPIRIELEKLADEKYQKFASDLLPGVNSVLGVRLPKLRTLAKQLSGKDWKENLERISDNTLEEVMLQGMMIGYIQCPTEERYSLIRDFVPKIDNWSVCDSFCCGLKFIESNKEEFFVFLQPYLTSKKEFEQRFGCVILLNYYIEKNWINKTIKALTQVKANGYYAKMALAWALAECYLSYPKKTLPVLTKGTKDKWIQQKAFQKILESRTITQEQEAEIRSLKKSIRS